MNTTVFDHKFNLNDTVYYKTDHGVNKGLIIRILLNKELSLSDGKSYNYINYDIIRENIVSKVAERNVFATPYEAFK